MNVKATMRIPVIIGVGEVIDKPVNPGSGKEPLELLLASVHEADEDAGGGWARRIDTVRVINQISWPYKDLPGLLAKRLRLRGAETIYGPVGGETPVRMLVDAAIDIANGHSDTTLLCGAESLKSAMALLSRGDSPAWSDEDKNQKVPRPEDYVTALAARYGLLNPVDVYPLYENATRAAWHQSSNEAQAESGQIWESMSSVAAQNPYAWSGKTMAAADITTPSEKNRIISHPYTKFLVAQNGVNQGAAVILTHRDAALEAGIAEEKLIYVWSGAGAHEPFDFLARDRYDHAPAMASTLNHTLEMNGLSIQDIEFFELYSCFPCVPKLARRVLDLSASTPLSVAGGLTFFGGPGNNYMTHAITAMVRALRNGPGGNGFLYGNGEYVTKHHAAIISTKAPPHDIQNANIQAVVDADYGPVPEIALAYEGPCRLETFSLSYGQSGKADRGTVIARTPDGRRVVARVTEAEPEALAMLADRDSQPIGRDGHVFDGGDGLLHWGLEAPLARVEASVLFEKLAPHIACVTINRTAKRNAVNGAVTRLMVQYVAMVEADPEIRVAILTGAGADSFCAGADLSGAPSRMMDLAAGGNGFAGFVNAKRTKPWIAAVNGFALGGGTELVLSCDLAVAAENAIFGLPEVKRGVIAAAGGAYRLPRAIPPRIAMKHVLTGEPFSAQQAFDLGLINQVVPADDVLAAALEIAKVIAECAPLSVAASRQLTVETFNQSDDELAELSMRAALRLMSSEDFREGPKAFLEKRQPVWKGR